MFKRTKQKILLENDLVLEVTLLNMMILESCLNISIKIFSALQKSLISKKIPLDKNQPIISGVIYQPKEIDKMTFGRLVNIYKKFRPQNIDIIEKLEIAIVFRNRIVHGLHEKTLTDIHDSILLAIGEKNIFPATELLLKDINNVIEKIEPIFKENNISPAEKTM